MKRIFLASLMIIGIISSASAVDVKPYIGLFPINYAFGSVSYLGGGDKPDVSYLGLGIPSFALGLKISDFRADLGVDFTSEVFTFNVFYDINVSDSFLPYIKVGFGYWKEDFEVNSYKEEASGTMYVIGCGIGYQVVDHLFIDAGIEYIYSKEKEKQGGVTTDDSTFKGCGMKLGARYQF